MFGRILVIVGVLGKFRQAIPALVIVESFLRRHDEKYGV
jgi:hypothetical protein